MDEKADLFEEGAGEDERTVDTLWFIYCCYHINTNSFKAQIQLDNVYLVNHIYLSAYVTSTTLTYRLHV